MFGSLGLGEIVLIAVVALIVLGPSGIPDAAKALGKGLAEFRRTSNDLRWQVMSTLESENAPPPKPKSNPPTRRPAPTIRKAEGTEAVAHTGEAPAAGPEITNPADKAPEA